MATNNTKQTGAPSDAGAKKQPDVMDEALAMKPNWSDPSQLGKLANQMLLHGGGRSVKLNMDGTLKDANAPGALDWLQQNGPQRQSVQDRKLALAQELRPDGGINQMAQRGAAAVAAQKALGEMVPKENNFTSTWGGDDIGSVRTATKAGHPVGFATDLNTPQAKLLHEFKPEDVQGMLGQLKQPELPPLNTYDPGTSPDAGAQFLPGFNPQNPENLTNRNIAAVRAREAGRQQRGALPVPSTAENVASVIGDSFSQGGKAQGNMISDLLGINDRMPAISANNAAPVQPKGMVGSALDWLEGAVAAGKQRYEKLGANLPSWLYDQVAASAAYAPFAGGMVDTNKLRSMLPEGSQTFVPPALEPPIGNYLNDVVTHLPGGDAARLMPGMIPKQVRDLNRARTVRDIFPGL